MPTEWKEATPLRTLLSRVGSRHKTGARYIAWTLGSGVYWAISLFLILLVSWVVGGDCVLERTDTGLRACGLEKRWAVVISFVVFAVA